MENCFALGFGKCKGKLTREHYLSEAVLNLILGKEGKITVEGMPWIPNGEKKNLTPSTLHSKILCEGHNGQLSPLDSEAEKFIRFLRPNEIQNSITIIGTLVEKWILKTLIGLSESGNLRNDSKQVRISKSIVETLFNESHIPEPFGLVYVHRENTFRTKLGVGITVHGNNENIVTSIGLNFFNLSFIFNLAEHSPTLPIVNIGDRNVVYRPTEINIQRNGFTSTMELKWFPKGYGKINITASKI